MTDSGLDFRVLGPVEVARRGEPVRVEAPKRRALLALLLMHANEVLSTDAILERLWNDDQPGGGRKTLQVHVSNLRKALEPERDVLVTEGGGYALRIDPAQIDAARFEQAIDEARNARPSDPERASAILTEALTAWRGRPYEDLAYESFIQGEIRRLEELRLTAIEDRLDADLAAGRHAGSIGELQSLIHEHPLQERFWELLMLALYRSGRQGEALRAYQQARRQLADELGIEPTPRLRRLEDQILFQDPALDLGTESSAPEDNLPTRVSSFLGRERELARLEEQLVSTRMITLTGAGGVGKTSLAIEASRLAAPRFLDGAWMVDLAPLHNGELVAQTVADTVGIADLPSDDALSALAGRLRSRQILLVLDNCEHLIDASAALADAVLRTAPGVAVLATSRQPLHIPGETVLAMEPLPVPPQGVVSADEANRFDSVRLFTARAEAAGGGFVLDDESAAAVVDICRRLDGIPLALELAAAQTSFLGAGQIADRLSERPTTLAGVERARPERHRTVHDMIEWSYELLDPTERALFDRLSVFEGVFELEAAQAVGEGNVVEVLGHLVDRSMMVARPGPEPEGEGRFRMLETLRAFGRERLEAKGIADSVRDQHMVYYRSLVERGLAPMPATNRLAWEDRVQLEYSNVRAALARSIDHEPISATSRFVGGLGHLWSLRLRNTEGWRWLDPMLDATEGADPEDRMYVLVAAAYTSSWGGIDYRRAERICDEAIALTREVGNRRLLAESLWARGRVGLSLGREDAAAYLAESRAVAAEFGDRWLMARADMIAPLDRAEARARLEECIDTFRAEGDHFLEAVTMSMLARVALEEGDLEEARRLTTESFNRHRGLGLRKDSAYTLYQLCAIHRLRGDLVEAAAFGSRALEAAISFDSVLLVTKALMHLGTAAIAARQSADGARLLAASDAIRIELGASTLTPWERSLGITDLVDKAREVLGEGDFTRATKEGAALSLGEATNLGFQVAARIGGGIETTR